LVVLTIALSLVAAWLTAREFPVQSASGSQAPPLTVANPLAIDGPLATLLGYVSSFGFVVYLIPVAAVLVRFRTSTGTERQQLKWFAYATSIVALLFVATLVGPVFSYLGELGSLVWVLAIDLIPISVAIAVLRYRLYDIDLLINRTLVYGGTTAVIGGAFFAGIVLLQALLRPFTTGSELSVAASTLVSFALFQPLRRRIQRAVDQRFYRSRYDAVRTVDAFSERLRDEVELDALRGDLLTVVGDTMQPAHASLWLRR
jgi:hypothetical protein